MNEFDWKEDAAIVCRAQRPLAIYENDELTITLRSKMDWDEDADTIITIAPANLPAVVQALSRFIPTSPKAITYKPSQLATVSQGDLLRATP